MRTLKLTPGLPLTLALALALALALVAMSPVHPGRAAKAEIDWEDIDFVADDGTTVAAEFGFLAVDERRVAANPAVIHLAMVRFPSTAAKPGPPIVFLADGPGLSGIEAARGSNFDAFMRLREVADVIALDQRGSGRSQPSLECSQRLKVGATKVLTVDSYADAYRKPLRDCVRSWESRGVDVGGYTTTESADDVDELRQALGAKQISLWGQGYGTHLALAVMRRHPDGVHRAALHGVWGPDDTFKLPKAVYTSLRQLGRLAARDPLVGPDMPDLVDSMERLTRQVEREPVSVVATDPFSGRLRTVVIDAFVLSAFAAIVVGNTDDYPFVPRVIIAVERDGFDEEIGEGALEVRGEQVGSLMTASMLCASGSSAKRAKKIAKQEDAYFTGRLIDAPFPDVCDVVPVEGLGDEFRARLRSDIPTLLVSGTLDGRTPRANAKAVGKGLGNAEHLTLIRGGHNDLIGGDPTIADAVAEFLRGNSPGVRRIVLPTIAFIPVD